MTDRRKRCFDEFVKTGLDGILFTAGANFQYLSECTSYFWQRNCFNLNAPVMGSHIIPECMIYMNREGKTTILTIPSKKDHFDTVKNDVVISYMDQFEDELRHIVDGKKIGIGRDCDEWFVRTLKEVDPAIETVRVETIFDGIRRIKDEYEIAQLRRLAEFTDDAVMYVVRHMQEGMTMFDCERGIIEYGLSHGIQDLSFPPTCGFKTRNTENALNIEPFEPERKLVPGTMVAFDIGYMDQGYCSDWGRTVYYGEAPELVRNGYAALQAAQCYMISQIKPGVTRYGDLYSYICDKAEELGYYQYLRFKREERGGNGHHIGTDVHEVPFLTSDSDPSAGHGILLRAEDVLPERGIHESGGHGPGNRDRR